MSVNKQSQVAKRYAEALFGTLNPTDHSDINEELRQVVLILADPKVYEAFHHPKTPKERKSELIKLMGLSSVAENFFLLITEKSRDTLIPSIAHHFEELVLAAQQTTKAAITSAVPLPDATLGELKEKLHKLTGKTVLLETKIDPSIGGGMIIKVDGKVIDGSVSHTLRKFHRSLLS